MTELIGRMRELDLLRSAVTSSRVSGARLFLHGEPGLGKSALLRQTLDEARAGGHLPLSCAGAPSESLVPYAALHQLLLPVLGRAETAGATWLDVLRRAVGTLDVARSAPDPVAVALATLELLRTFSPDVPLLLAVDDAQWLDPSSARVLAFVARRTDDLPILLLCASREPLRGPLAEVPFTTLELAPLGAADSTALARHVAPDLHASLRSRLVRVAQGNPLAVVELAPAWERLPQGSHLPSPVPITDRVESAFAARLDELPADARALLLLAVLRGSAGDATSEVVEAARSLGHDVAGTDAFLPAVDAGLVIVVGRDVAFRHPLVRSAIARRAGAQERAEAHRALALAIGDPDRAAWHRAAGATGPDEGIAQAVERSAESARRRGAVGESVTMLQLAASLTPDPARQGGRLVQAAYHAADLGHEDATERLLDEAEELPLGPADRARAQWRRYRPQDVVGDYDRLRELMAALRALHGAGQTQTALDSLAPAADLAFWRGIEPRCRDLFCSTVDSIAPRHDARRLAALALTAPVSRARAVREDIAALGIGGTVDAEQLALVGRAASIVGDLAAGTAHLERAIGPLRSHGRLGLLGATLVTTAWNCWHLGRWDDARAAAAEVQELGRIRDRPMVTAILLDALLDAVRTGDVENALHVCDSVEDVVAASGSPALREIASYTRGTVLMIADRAEEAYELTRGVFETAERHPPPESVASLSHGTLPLYADAAARVGASAAARPAVARLRPVLRGSGSSLLRASVVYAEAVLTEAADAEPAYRAAVDGLAGWP